MQNRVVDSPTVHGAHRSRRMVGSRAVVEESAKEPPKVHVQQQDGRIESIVVTCSCGETITIDCGYESQ